MARINASEIMIRPFDDGIELIGITRSRRGTKARVGSRKFSLAGLSKIQRHAKIEEEINQLLGRSSEIN